MGMRLLRDDGWDKVRQGVTTLAEVLRVTREEG
jgi:type II secretory ATPase GspE/PulE/Tfp pilus assembly ATPase PilB-like protein